jgi:hypothetical protein
MLVDTVCVADLYCNWYWAVLGDVGGGKILEYQSISQCWHHKLESITRIRIQCNWSLDRTDY